MRALLLSALLVCLLQAAVADFVPTVYTARLEGQQVIPPALADTSNLGVGVCTYDRNQEPPSFTCSVQNTYNLQAANITSVAVYNAPRGLAATGGALYSFLEYTIESNYNLLITNWTAQASYSLSQQESDFLNGDWYIEIAADGLAIRGQLEHSDRVYSILSYKQTIPAALSSNAYGVTVATYSPTSPTRLLSLEVINNVVQPTAIEVFTGTYGVVGTFVFSLISYTSPVFQSITVTIDEEDLLLADLLYMTVPSVRNPNGDIRGQLVTIDYLPRAKFSSRLNNFLTSPSSASSAVGCALWVYHCDTQVLEYLVFHNVQEPVQAVIYNGLPGLNGTALFTLTRAVSPIYGSEQLDTGYEQLLFNTSLFVNIESTPYPDGEIVGQIGTQYPYYAYLSGTYVVPPVTTAAVGCATFQIVGNTTFDYDIQYSVTYPLEVRLSEGPEGINGIVNLVFGNYTSPVIGQNITLNTTELSTLANELFYIEVTSEAYPIDGEVRGQIYTLNTTCALQSIVAPFTIIFPPPPYYPIYVGAAAAASASLALLLLAALLALLV